jgi:hypothetical protein
MGTNCAPLLTDLFLYSHEAEFVQKLLHEKIKSLALTFSSKSRCINDIVSISSNQFQSHIILTYPNEVETKDFTECSTYASYLDVIEIER